MFGRRRRHVVWDPHTMDLTNLPLFKMVHARMQWAVQRHRVLAQNVSNINTPEYRTRDVREPDFRRILNEGGAGNPAAVPVARTNPAHQPGTLPEPDPYRVRAQTRSFETTLDENTVVLEEQMQKVGETKGRYMMAASLFERNMAMLKTAIKPNR